MATFGTNNISLNAVRAVLGESSKSLWAVCHNPNINKWAKYSPLTNHGANIPFSCTPVAKPFDCTTWTYNTPQVTEARLGDFRNYNHAAIIPISCGFPTELYSNFNNVFSVGVTPDGGDNINHTSVYNANNLYFGVAIRRKSDTSKMIWCTNPNKGATTVDVNLNGFSAYFGNGATVECIMFYSTSNKTISGADIASNFYSVKADTTVIDRNEYTIRSYSPPTTYESIRVIPVGEMWSYDEITFDNISIEVKGKVQANYRHRIRVTTPDGVYSDSFSMLFDATVNAGETKVIFSTGIFTLRFYGDYNLVFVQVLDLKDNNKILTEVPVMRMIN